MKPPVETKIASPSPSATANTSGFYLTLGTKVWILATAIVVMIAASVYALLQPLNPHPSSSSFSTAFWYPRETNPYSRLKAVVCAKGENDDYACRLNSVAVHGTGSSSEVWAVGNVGLVLHRRAGQTDWEQLTVLTVPASDVAPEPQPKPAPTQSPAPIPRPLPIVTPIPQPQVRVPSLLGLNQGEAEKIAASAGLKLNVGYSDSGKEMNSAPQQSGLPQLRIMKQSPAPGTLVAPGAIVNVVLGFPAPAKASFLDRLIPTVYASEKAPPKSAGTPPAESSPVPSRSPQRSVARPRPSPSQPLPLQDDLIYVSCSSTQGCAVLGRTGRIYQITGDVWTFEQARFDMGSALPTLVYANPGLILARLNSLLSICKLNNIGRMTYSCTEGVQPQDSYLLRTVSQSFRDSLEFNDPSFAQTTIDLSHQYYDVAQFSFPGAKTSAALRAYATGYDKSAFVVGDEGTILSTNDGATWNHETQGPDGAHVNHRLPALWYWTLALLVIIISTLVVAAPPPPLPAELSVADWSVSDAPLKPGDVDSLGFTPMALGLSRFIRNPKTQPPVTIAIEGEWGEGKSSVMSLLRGDLEKSRYRPVWFNAWHHQSEEQLLASLLEHIKNEAVPPWWYIDNWIFRVRLLFFRLKGKLPLMVVLSAALFGGLAFEISRHGIKLDDFYKFSGDVIKLVKYLLPWSNQHDLPDDLGHFGLVATMIAIFAAIFRKAKAFGINPSKLTDNLRDAATIKDIKPDPGVRPQFAREFGDLCRAWSWGGRRVIIFIDDLDRCRPESVVTVLESINFLTTAGDCMMVLGMAEKQVTHCVGLGFTEIAEAEAAYAGGGNNDQEKAEARFKYGELYIKKLVNIVAPLPKTTPELRRNVLEARAAQERIHEEKQKTASRWRMMTWDRLSQVGHMAFKAAPGLIVAAILILALVIGYREGSIPSSTGGETQTPKPLAGPAPEPTPGTQTVAQGERKPLPFERPTSHPATLDSSYKSARDMWWSYLLNACSLLVLFGILAYLLSARTNQDAQNSAEFEQSLRLWGQYILGICDTPREVKRALNDLRYQAMTRRRNGPSVTRAERLVKAIRARVTGQPEDEPLATRIDEAALPPLKAADLANLTVDERKSFMDPSALEATGSETLQRLTQLKQEHINHFHRWMDDVRITSEPASAGSEEHAEAQAASA
jgi:hypothetical protein